MNAQNLAIVWGPNLMWPRYDSGDIAVNMVHQNQIIEFLLLEFDHVFKQLLTYNSKTSIFQQNIVVVVVGIQVHTAYYISMQCILVWYVTTAGQSYGFLVCDKMSIFFAVLERGNSFMYLHCKSHFVSPLVGVVWVQFSECSIVYNVTKTTAVITILLCKLN